MQALSIYKAVTMDQSNFLERLLGQLEEHDVRYCVIGGQAVNAYAEPLVSLDLDIVIGLDRIEEIREILSREFKVEEFPHSLNVTAPGSSLRAQIQTDPRYGDFVARAERRDVLGIVMPVAAVEDVLQGKVWAALDRSRRPSKRLKDLADISRLIEAHPGLRHSIPAAILRRLNSIDS
jgi:hypothetical protein